jgi:hypothetical protein
MVHRLDGVTAKLERADTHLLSVKDAIAKIITTDPDIIPAEHDPESGRYIFRAQRDSSHPDWLAPIIGDCVHNFRAALDYLVWELVALAGNIGTSSTEFPIFIDPDLYAKDAPRKIRGIDPRAETVIARLQPFAGPNSQPGNPAWREPEEEPLALLYGLDKQDKHRSLNLTEDQLSLRLIIPAEYQIHVSEADYRLPGNFKRGAMIGELRTPRSDLKIHMTATTHVAFEHPGPAARQDVMQTLDSIRAEVHGRVLPALAPFFPRR